MQELELITGKERDAETSLDYFGARYLSSAQGRWMIPDWSATPQAVPYADWSDPQTLNLYGYARNRPLGHADPEGHDVTFADLKLLFQFSRIASESPSLESEYLLAVLDKKMDVRVEERGLRKNEQNSPGDTKVSETDENGVTKVVIYVDGNGRTNDDTIVHEWGHEKDAREMGGTAFVREVKKQQSRYYEKGQHNERPVEEGSCPKSVIDDKRFRHNELGFGGHRCGSSKTDDRAAPRTLDVLAIRHLRRVWCSCEFGAGASARV